MKRKFFFLWIMPVALLAQIACTNPSSSSPKKSLVTDSSIDLSYAVGQMMMIGFNGKSVDESSPIVQEIKNYHIGGVIIDNHRDPQTKKITTNIRNPVQLKTLIQQLQYYAKKYHDYPLLIAINQEGGLINTLKPRDGFQTKNDPSQFKLGKEDNKKKIFAATYQRARFLQKMGINLNLAPVADLNINPKNPAVGGLQRSFGSDPARVTADLLISVRAYQRANIFCTLKHFPGLGSANKNTDYADVDVSETWQADELLPYRHLIKASLACPFIMVGHLVNKKLDESGLPASLSKKIVTELLRGQLQYSGLMMTDDLDAVAIRRHYPMREAIEKAVLAGNDIILYGGTQGYDPDEDARLLFDHLFSLAQSSPAIRERVLVSFARIKKLKQAIKL